MAATMSDHPKEPTARPQPSGFVRRISSNHTGGGQGSLMSTQFETMTSKVINTASSNEPAFNNGTAHEDATHPASPKTIVTDSESEDPEDAALIARARVGRSKTRLPEDQSPPFTGNLLVRQAVVVDNDEPYGFTFKEAIRTCPTLNKSHSIQRIPQLVTEDIDANTGMDQIEVQPSHSIATVDQRKAPDVQLENAVWQSSRPARKEHPPVATRVHSKPEVKETSRHRVACQLLASTEPHQDRQRSLTDQEQSDLSIRSQPCRNSQSPQQQLQADLTSRQGSQGRMKPRSDSSHATSIAVPKALTPASLHTYAQLNASPEHVNNGTAHEDVTHPASPKTIVTDSESEDPEDAALIARARVGRSKTRLPEDQSPPFTGNLLVRQAVVVDNDEPYGFTFKEAIRTCPTLNKSHSIQRIPQLVTEDIDANTGMDQIEVQPSHSIATVDQRKAPDVQLENAVWQSSRPARKEHPPVATRVHSKPEVKETSRHRVACQLLASTEPHQDRQRSLTDQEQSDLSIRSQPCRNSQSPQQQLQADLTSRQGSQGRMKPRSDSSHATSIAVPKALTPASLHTYAQLNASPEHEHRGEKSGHDENDTIINHEKENEKGNSRRLSEAVNGGGREANQSPLPHASHKKRKAKQSRAKLIPGADQIVPPGFTFKDYLDLAVFEADQKVTEMEAQIRAMQQNYQNELASISNDKDVLQGRLMRSEEQMEMLNVTIKENARKQEEREVKVVRLKKFIDGLSNDFNSMRKGATAINDRIEEVAKECSNREQVQVDLSRIVSNCAEQTTKVKNRTLQTLQEARIEIDEYRVKNRYLEQQLSERVGLLAEERDRRSQLERQLVSASSAANEVHRSIALHHEKELDELVLVQARIEQHQDSSAKLAEKIQDTMALIQGLNTQESSNLHDLISIRSNIECLSQSMACVMEAVKKPPEELTVSATSLHELVENGLQDLKGLKNSIETRDADFKQISQLQVIIAELNEKLKTSDVRVAECETELQHARKIDAELKDNNSALQTKLTCLQDGMLSHKDDVEQLRRAKAELHINVHALENLKADSKVQAEHLRLAKAENLSFQTQINALRTQIQEAEITTAAHDYRVEQLQQKHAADQESLRKNLELQEAQFITQRLAEKDNEIKRITTERDSVAKDLQHMDGLRTEIQHKLVEVRQQMDSEKDSEIKTLSLLVESQKTEIERLRYLLPDPEKPTDGELSKPVQRDIQELCCQQATQTEEAQEKLKEHTLLQKRVEGLQDELSQARTRNDAAEAEFQTERDEHKAGLQQLRDSCQQTVREENIKVQQQIVALQDALASAQDELQAEIQKNQEFRADVEASWEIELQAHREQIASIKLQAAQESGPGETGPFTKEHLREKQDQLKETDQQDLAGETRFRWPEKQLQRQSPVPATEANMSGLTPSNTAPDNAPHRPKKKVDSCDRNAMNSVPFSFPQLQRPGPQTNLKSQDTGPDVSPLSTEASQPVEQSTAWVAETQENTGPLAKTASSENSASCHLDERATAIASAEVAEETQAVDLPSFASFTAMVDLTNVPRSSSSLSGITVPSTGSAVAQVVDDSQHVRPMTDKEDYIFHKQFPLANSASRRSNFSGETSAAMRNRTPAPKDVLMVIRTPENHMNPKTRPPHSENPSRTRNGTSNSPNSFQVTPNYQKQSIPASQTYAGHGSASENFDQSRTTSFATSDPRLVGRTLPLPGAAKRKPPSQIVEGYEQERKKRLALDKSTRTTEVGRYSFRDRTSSISSAFLTSGPAVGTPKGLNGSKSRPRLPTVGGGGTPQNPHGKKLSKSKLPDASH
nr:hypothetical protein CFP56_71745 [Quercus suber]